jgi:hypothetical protein
VGRNSSKAHNLPRYLTESKLPMSATVARQEYKRRLKLEWKRKWSESPRYTTLSQIDLTMPSNKFLHLMEGLWRTQASIMTQL